MKPLSSFTIFLSSSSHRLFRRTPLFSHQTETLVGISHFSTSSPDSSSSSSYHSSSRRNQEDVRNVRVSVWWDFENCQIPCNVNVYKVTQFITAAVRNVGIKGPIQITAFGDVLQLSRSNQEALSSTGINLTHIPNGGKNSADRSLLVDLMYWVSQNPPPAHLFLISGDRDFASTLHRLRMNNYNILLASTDNAPAVLCSAASIMWQWTSVVKGENLNGKHFNQPPDGPYASWYGHYRVALEDPFAVCNQISNQNQAVQSEEVSDSNSEIKPRPIPKVVLNVIRGILNSYPKGMSITELRSELGKSNVTIEKDFYGHKKFSQFLLAMPNLLRLKFEKDGQHVIHGISPKNHETCVPTVNSASVPSTTTKDTNKTKDSVPVVAFKEDGAHKLSSSSKSNEAKLSTDSQKLPRKQEEKLHVQEQLPVIEEVKEGEVNLGQPYPAKIDKAIVPKVGTFKSMWRKWFKGNDAHQEKIFHTNSDCSTSEISNKTINLGGNTKDSKDKSSEVDKVSQSSLSTNEVIKDAEIAQGSAENDDKVNKPRGIFDKIVSWCKFWETDKNSDELNAEFSKNDEKIPKSYSVMQEICTESFWNDLLAFLETSKGSDAVLQSKTRHEMVLKLQQSGPSELQSLNETLILHLVESLISEKKWILETTSQTFPFKLVTPSRRTSSIKPPNSKESDINSQGQKGQIADSSSSPTLTIKKKVLPKNRSQILNHCQKLVNEVVNQHPDGFKMSSFKKLFLEKYGYNLEVQQLGYQKLATLLQIMPGVKLEDNHIFPSVDRKTHSENDTQWEELGPISQTKTKKDEIFETVSDNDLSDSDSENSLTGLEKQSNKYMKEEESSSSLLQILDSWYSNKEDNSKKIESDESDENIDQVKNINKYEEKQKVLKRYSFVEEKAVDDDKENLINGILGSLKKSGNGSPESKVEG